MLVLLLSTAWIFGPLSSGEAELRLGAAYQQSSTSNLEGRTVKTQRLRSIVGADLGVQDWLSIGLGLPLEWAQNVDQGQLFYRRAELADVELDVRIQTSPTWQFGLTMTIPGHNSDDALTQRFPHTAARFPEIGSGELRVGGFVSGRARRGPWLHAGRIALLYGGQRQAYVTRALGYSSFRVFEGWLTIGPIIDLEIRGGNRGSERYRVGLLERLGPARGWAFELLLHTDVITDGAPASSGASASLVWRK